MLTPLTLQRSFAGGLIDGQLVDISGVEVTKLLCELLLTNPTPPPQIFSPCALRRARKWGVYRCRSEDYGEECIFVCKTVRLWLLTLHYVLTSSFIVSGGECGTLCVSWRAGGSCFTCFVISFPSPHLSYQDPLETAFSKWLATDLNRDENPQ